MALSSLNSWIKELNILVFPCSISGSADVSNQAIFPA